jgi:hypothetical protein
MVAAAGRIPIVDAAAALLNVMDLHLSRLGYRVEPARHAPRRTGPADIG